MVRGGRRELESTTAARSPRPRDVAWIVLLALLGSLGGALFNRLASDRLAPSALSDLRGVLGGLGSIGFLTIGLQLTLAGAMAGAGGRARLIGPGGWWRVATASAVVALLGGAATAVVIDASSSFRLAVGALVAATTTVMLVSVVPRAELLADAAFVQLGVLYVVGPAVRLAAGWFLFDDSGAAIHLVPVLLGETVTAITAFVLRRRRPSSSRTVSMRNVLNGIAASFGMMVLFAACSVALRSRLGSDAPVFNDSAAAVRPVVYLPLIVSVLYLPAIATSPVGSVVLRRNYHLAAMWTAVLAAIPAFVTIIAPDDAARLVLGDADGTSHATVRMLAVTWLLASVCIVPVLQYVAHGSRLALLVWGPAVVVLAGQLLTSSSTGLAAVSVVGAAGLFAALFLPALLRVQPVVHAMRAPAELPDDDVETGGDITVVIPSYNPGPAVVDTIHDVARSLEQAGHRATIIAVTDGSTDGSDALIDTITLPGLVHVRHDQNQGKGAALRTGFERARTELVAFIDADGDLPASVLPEMVHAQRTYGADIVFGSKLHPDSVVEMSGLRHLYSTCYRALIRALFQLDIRDTQTGVKLFRRRLLDTVLPTLRENAFALDLELFIAARAAGYVNYVEVPVVLRRQSGSTISLSGIRRMFGHTLRLFWRAKIALAYSRSAATGSLPTGQRATS